MRVGLIDVDGHRFPNLCLMKLSAYHRANGDITEWWEGDFTHYDVIYKSKVFTQEYTSDLPDPVNTNSVLKGGTGYQLSENLPDMIEHQYPDYRLYNNPKFANTAYGFLSRGCPRNCQFCIVGKKEGLCSKKVANLSEFWSGQKTIKLLDPNLLACKDHMDLIEQLIDSKATIDFTQGLDARCITPENVHSLSKLKISKVHFAFDNMEDEKQICKGLELYKQKTNIDFRKTGIYILTNFNTTHQQDLYRVHRVQELGYLPYVMVYNKTTAPAITRDLQRWSNNRIVYQASGGNFQRYQKHFTAEPDGQLALHLSK